MRRRTDPTLPAVIEIEEELTGVGGPEGRRRGTGEYLSPLVPEGPDETKMIERSAEWFRDGMRVADDWNGE